MSNILPFKLLSIAKRWVNCVSAEVKRVYKASAFLPDPHLHLLKEAGLVPCLVRKQKAWFSFACRRGPHCRDGSKIPLQMLCNTLHISISRDNDEAQAKKYTDHETSLTPSGVWKACSPMRTSLRCYRMRFPSGAPREPCSRGYLWEAERDKILITTRTITEKKNQNWCFLNKIA